MGNNELHVLGAFLCYNLKTNSYNPVRIKKQYFLLTSTELSFLAQDCAKKFLGIFISKNRLTKQIECCYLISVVIVRHLSLYRY